VSILRRSTDAVEQFHADRVARINRDAEAAEHRSSPHPILPANARALELAEEQRRERSPDVQRQRAAELAALQQERNRVLGTWQAQRGRMADEAARDEAAVRDALLRGKHNEAAHLRAHARELRDLIRPGGEFDALVREFVPKGIAVMPE
jgi:hypothetical protein